MVNLTWQSNLTCHAHLRLDTSEWTTNLVSGEVEAVVRNPSQEFGGH